MDKNLKDLHLAVLMGGPGSEREVSLRSGAAVARAFRGGGYRVTEVDVHGPDFELPPGIDLCVNMIHGTFGEDGQIQTILDRRGVAYTGEGEEGSRIAFDKLASKKLFVAAGVPTPRWEVLAPGARPTLPLPVVVKAPREGSSVGVYIVREAANSPPQLADEMPDTVMVEAYAPGRELTTAVMGDRALTVTDIVTEGWYDYHAKYTPGGSRHVCPAAVPPEIFAACLDHALAAHRALGCRGLSRTDFRWDDRRGLAGLVLLETNTQPGMTPTSLAPEQAAACGISFPDLCRWLVEDASCGR